MLPVTPALGNAERADTEPRVRSHQSLITCTMSVLGHISGSGNRKYRRWADVSIILGKCTGARDRRVTLVHVRELSGTGLMSGEHSWTEKKQTCCSSQWRKPQMSSKPVTRRRLRWKSLAPLASLACEGLQCVPLHTCSDRHRTVA